MLISFGFSVYLLAHDSFPELPCTLDEHDRQFLTGQSLFCDLSIHRPATFKGERQQDGGEGEEPTKTIDENQEVVIVGVDEEGWLETCRLEKEHEGVDELGCW